MSLLVLRERLRPWARRYPQAHPGRQHTNPNPWCTGYRPGHEHQPLGHVAIARPRNAWPQTALARPVMSFFRSPDPDSPNQEKRTGDLRTDERAPFHSITSSARNKIAVGTSIPTALAVLRFTTNSNLFGCSIGMSPTLAPLRILATCV